ncbi:MAG: hypothetical protein KJ737_19480 [Proteobacteria bacterium]|nr:hypothetical protein [Pseudomonadota bacterium]
MDEILLPEKVERYFRCRFYDECLDKAAEEDWISFSCLNCPLFPQNNHEDMKGEESDEP